MQDRAFSQYSKTFSKALVNYRPILKFKDFQGFQRTLRTLKEASKYEVFKELVIDESTFGLISVAQPSQRLLPLSPLRSREVESCYRILDRTRGKRLSTLCRKSWVLSRDLWFLWAIEKFHS